MAPRCFIRHDHGSSPGHARHCIHESRVENKFLKQDINAADIDALLHGYQVESRKDVQHINELGLVLFKFRLKNRKKRVLWFYSKAISPEFDNLLDVV
jgi:hypothetical protein